MQYLGDCRGAEPAVVKAVQEGGSLPAEAAGGQGLRPPSCPVSPGP
jgi:hypothetical protein